MSAEAAADPICGAKRSPMAIVTQSAGPRAVSRTAMPPDSISLTLAIRHQRPSGRVITSLEPVPFGGPRECGVSAGFHWPSVSFHAAAGEVMCTSDRSGNILHLNSLLSPQLDFGH